MLADLGPIALEFGIGWLAVIQWCEGLWNEVNQ